jgi:hypothetical protein
VSVAVPIAAPEMQAPQDLDDVGRSHFAVIRRGAARPAPDSRQKVVIRRRLKPPILVGLAADGSSDVQPLQCLGKRHSLRLAPGSYPCFGGRNR